MGIWGSDSTYHSYGLDLKILKLIKSTVKGVCFWLEYYTDNFHS